MKTENEENQKLSIRKFIFSYEGVINWWNFIILLIFISCILGCLLYEPTKNDITILFHNDTLKVSPEDLSTHNMNLISTLQGRESTYINSIVSQEASIMQNRVIYMALIGVILTLLYKNNGNRNIYIILLFLIIFFYGLDIHQEDLLTRSAKTKGFTSKSLDFMVNLKPTDTIWYYIDYAERNSKFFEKYTEFPNRLYRKSHAAFKPKPIQFVYYFLPLIFIYFYVFKLGYREK